MLEVEIRNFQSIEHVEFRVNGFTALVGRSNIGKSAIVRAVKAALTGAPVDSFVRHGSQCLRRAKDTKTCKCACFVSIKGPGFDLVWEKGDAVNRYEFNGQQYTAANRGTPEFLQDTVDMVKVGDSKELLQVSDQFSPIFLLDKTGTVVADVLSDVAHLDQINDAMRLVEKDRKEAVAARKLRDKDILDLQMRVTSFDGLDASVMKVQEVETFQQDLQLKQGVAVMLDRFIANVFGLAREIKTLEKVNTIVVPDNNPVEKTQERYEQLRRFSLEHDERDRLVKRMEVAYAVETPNNDLLSESSKRFTLLEGWLNKIRSSKDQFLRWGKIEALTTPESAPLEAAYERFQKLSKLATSHQAAVQAIEALEFEHAQANRELQAVQKELDALGRCPTCTQPIAAVAHSHAGVGGL